LAQTSLNQIQDRDNCLTVKFLVKNQVAYNVVTFLGIRRCCSSLTSWSVFCAVCSCECFFETAEQLLNSLLEFSYITDQKYFENLNWWRRKTEHVSSIIV
jgi:hypothetical protein